MFFDSHAHLNNEQFSASIIEHIERAAAAGVEKILVAGYDMPSSVKAAAYAKRFENIYASVGIHPHDADTFSDAMLNDFTKLLSQQRVVALGEIGLDHYKEYSPRDIQAAVFRKQLEFAKKKDLPVIIHSRDAAADTMEIIKEIGHFKGVLHCYSGSVEHARQYADMGFYISLAGPVTFKNAKKAAAVAHDIPLDKLLVETDCPYLAPVPYRGKQNCPAYVVEVARKIAEIKHIPLKIVEETTYENTLHCFGIH